MNTSKRFARKNTFDRPRFDSRYGLRAVASVALGMVMLPLGFTEQKYPERLVTRRDVLRAKPDADQIDIRLLPLQDYPLLSKFSQVKQIFYYNEGEKGATDAKLKALASLNLTNVVFISLLGCRLVTDEGIRVLAGIRSLKSLQLEGTAITDAACHIMLTNMHLSGVNSGVNVANCRGVTIKGITALANSDLMEGLDFSTDNLSQDEVLTLVESFKKIKWCMIVDPQGKLDSKLLQEKAAEKKIHLDLRRTGALQEMGLYR